MRNLTNQLFRTAACYITTGIFAISSFAYAQDSSSPPPADNQQQSSASSGGWKRVDDPPPQDQSAPPVDNQQQPTDDQQQSDQAQPNYDQPNQAQPNYDQPDQNQPDQNQQNDQIPAQLTIPQGTFITVRANEFLSSDKNQVGDPFTATLVRPVVVDGVVIAEPGQTVAGRVVEAKKAGRVEGVARLAVQLTDLTLVDGQQVSIQSQLISRSGPTSVGRDAGAIAGTTALGAAIGADADWGRGAAIGAGAGAALATIGVLVTRGHPSVIYPEQILTFRVETPVTISTERSPQAFHFVQPNEYDQPYNQQSQPRQEGRDMPPPPPPYYGSYCGYPCYSYGYPYPYYYGYPYYWGPGISFYFGPGFWGGGHYYRGYYGRGFYGHGYYGAAAPGVGADTTMVVDTSAVAASTAIAGLKAAAAAMDSPVVDFPVAAVLADSLAAVHKAVLRASLFQKFSAFRNSAQSIAELGFIVVQVDGMGTAGRSKAFHDHCYKNLGDSGLPDHIAVIKQMAEKNPYMDLNRVGIYGVSAGGYDATRECLEYVAFGRRAD